MGVNFNFQYSGIAETAPRLPNSAGDSKKRLHLFGLQENDRFAIAVAKQIMTDGKTSPKPLNWLQRKFYVLVPDPNNKTVWYKVNKNSLTKRFQIDETELTKAESSNSLLELLEAKYQARQEWEQIEGDSLLSNGRGFSDFHSADSLASRFIDALVNAGIKPAFKAMAFWPTNNKHFFFSSDGASNLNLRNYEKGQILSIIYREFGKDLLAYGDYNPRDNIVHDDNKEALDLINGPASPLFIIELSDAEVKYIKAEGKFPEEVLRQLKS